MGKEDEDDPSLLGCGQFLGGELLVLRYYLLVPPKKNTPDSSSLAVQTVALQVFGMLLQLRWHQLVRRDLGPRSLSLKTINGLSKRKQPRLFVCRFGLLVWVVLTNLDLHHFLDVFLKKVFKKKEVLKKKQKNFKLDMITKTGWLSKYNFSAVSLSYIQKKTLRYVYVFTLGKKGEQRKAVVLRLHQLKEVPTHKYFFTWPCWNCFEDRKMPAFWR